jgi:hypothetical protein
MTTLILTEHPDSGYLVSRQSRPRERLAARLRAWQLDTAIANGADPDSSAVLSLRANKLISRPMRRRISRSVRSLLQHSRRPPHPIHEGAAVCWREVVRARPLLAELAARLAGTVPVDARGVAQLQLLLTDGTSPLFDRSSACQLQAALAAVLETLEPCQ